MEIYSPMRANMKINLNPSLFSGPRQMVWTLLRPDQCPSTEMIRPTSYGTPAITEKGASFIQNEKIWDPFLSIFMPPSLHVWRQAGYLVFVAIFPFPAMRSSTSGCRVFSSRVTIVNTEQELNCFAGTVTVGNLFFRLEQDQPGSG